MALMMDHERWVPPPQTMPTPRRGDDTSYTSSRSHTNRGRSGPACASPWEAGAVARQRRVRAGGALGGGGWRLAVPGGRGDEPASGGIGLRTLVLLRRGQLPTQIFDRTTQLNKNMIGQQVVALPDRQGIEGLG